MRAAGAVVSADGGGAGGGGGDGVLEIVSDGSLTVIGGTGPVATVSATASSVGADPDGTAAAAVAAHVALPDPHPEYTTPAEAAAAAPVQSVFGRDGDVVAIAGDYTATQISSTGPSTVQADLDALVAIKSRVAYQFSDIGNRPAGAALRSGGDLFGNLTPNSAIGQASVAVTIREVAWRRNVTAAGFFRVSVLDATLNELGFVLVPAAALVATGATTGLALAVPAGGAVACFWDLSSSGTTQDPSVTVYAEPS